MRRSDCRLVRDAAGTMHMDYTQNSARPVPQATAHYLPHGERYALCGTRISAPVSPVLAERTCAICTEKLPLV